MAGPDMISAHSALRHLPLGGSEALRTPDGVAHPVSEESGGFVDALIDSLDEVDAAQAKADVTVERFLAGEDVPVHRVMIALTEAESTMRLATAVATKVIDAYQEISNLQV